MFRTTHIRTKLAVALAVPLAALVAVAGFEVLAAKRDVDATRSQTDLATASVGPGSLLIHLQDERNRAAIDLIGLGDAAGLPVADNAEARALVEEAAPQLRAELERRGHEAVSTFEPAWAAMDALDELRADVDAYDGPMDISNDEFANEVFQRYTDIVESFFDATSTVALTLDDAGLRNGVEIVDAAARQSEMRARIVRSLVLAVLTGTTDSPATMQEVAALLDRADGFDDDIRTHATGAYAGVGDATFAEPAVQRFNRQVEQYLAGEDVDIISLLDAVRSRPDIGYTGLRNRAAELLSSEASRIEAGAVERQRLFAGIAVGALLLAVLVTWLASRSITRPLRSLREQAEEMAGVRLPAAVRQILETPDGDDVAIPDVAPIEVRTRDEVSEVAAALSAVQASALDLAVEQAVLRRNISDSYVNLGRRNQNLLSRQLDFITDLERNESDPDTLEGLFRLDHLATRMRRNAESLLVLAGVEPPRQWAAPVKVSDVVRAALGEVEDYQRVIVRHLEPAAVTGAVASDIAHVLAELVENALTFSPPEQTVEVKGRLTTSGYTLAITDNGLGMAAEDLAKANRRLAGKESFTVAPSRYLGHYVAGHLASRIGLVVELHDNPAGGITARVDVPMALVANDDVASTSAPPVAGAAPAPAPAPITVEERPDAGVTANGLPRRGERSAPSEPAPVEPAPALEPAAPPTAAAVEADPPAPTGTAPEPVAEAPAPARGFGGLAVTRPSHGSMYGIAARAARNGEPVPAHQPGTEQAGAGSTAAGLARRVPGAQRPDVVLGGPAAEAVGDATVEPARSSPEDVYSFLSSFQSGVARGRADAHGDDAESQEDHR